MSKERFGKSEKKCIFLSFIDGDSGILGKIRVFHFSESNLRPQFRLLVRMVYDWAIGDTWQGARLLLHVGSGGNGPTLLLELKFPVYRILPIAMKDMLNC